MIVQRYVLKRLIERLTVSTFVCLLLVVPPMLVAAVSKLGGVPLETILAYLPLQSIELAPYLVPFILLISVAGTYAALAADREWLGMHFSGINPWVGVLPCLLLALGVSLTIGLLLTTVFPALRYKQGVMVREAQLEVLAGLFPGQTQIKIGGFALMGRARTGDSLFDVVIHVPPSSDGQKARTVHAKRATLGFAEGVLSLDLDTAWMGEGEFQMELDQVQLAVKCDDILASQLVDRTRIKFMTSKRIDAILSSGEETRHTREQLAFEYHRRLALAASASIFALVGIATGLGSRGHAALFAIGWSLLTGGVYFFSSIRVCEFIGLSGRVEPWLGAWSINIVFGLISGLAMLRAMQK